MKINTNLSINMEIMEILEARAKIEHRSVKNQLEEAIIRYVEKSRDSKIESLVDTVNIKQNEQNTLQEVKI